jgi:DNA primase large subunit
MYLTLEIMTVEDLRKSDVMRHLLDALEEKQDIGHYGRLVFAMIARHFLSQEEVIEQLLQDPDCDEAEAKSLYQQVQGKDYSPPKRDRILGWQQQQEFPICPNPDDPDACNVYRDLQFPEHVYEHISSYYQHKA